jgi:hypothetical protein
MFETGGTLAAQRLNKMPQQQLKTERQHADKEPSAEGCRADAATYALTDPHTEQSRDNGEQRAGDIVDRERAFSCEPDCQRHGRYGK